jgi:hypothetical protein
MSDWFSKLAAGTELPAHAASELEERGFVVFPGMVPVDRMKRLAAAYDTAVTAATGDGVRVGSTSTKVSDLVNREAEFDDLYVFPPLLEACCRVIGRPFKLSSFAARTVRAGSKAQELHRDAQVPAPCWSSTGPHGMATPRTDRTDRAGRSRVRSFPGTGGPRPTSRRACSPGHAPGSARSRSTCSPSDWLL